MSLLIGSSRARGEYDERERDIWASRGGLYRCEHADAAAADEGGVDEHVELDVGAGYDE